MTSFHCFRSDKNKHKKCEWQEGGLRDFAAQFNKAYGKSYSLSKCLDIADDGQPEVLLEAHGSQHIVIERKQIPYPSDYYMKHQHLHDFGEYFTTSYNKRLKPKLSQYLYRPSVNANSICGYKKSNFNWIIERKQFRS